MTYHLFLDDERHPWSVSWVKIPEAVWQVVRNYDEFVETIETYGIPTFVSFDHDLADAHYVAMLNEVEGRPSDYGTEKTGFECAKWLVDYCIDREIKFPGYEVHSMNPIGSKRIKDYIEWAKSKINTL